MPNNKKQKILLVDDDADIAAMVRAWLPADEYAVESALDGNTGLEKFEKEKPDLILLDVMMPGMTGYEFCEKLSTLKKDKESPVIFLTGLADEQSKGKALTLGAVDYLVKPVAKQALLDSVRKGILTSTRWAGALGADKQNVVEKTQQTAFSFSRFKDHLKTQDYFKKNYSDELQKISSGVFCGPADHLGLSPEQRGQLIAAFAKLEFLEYVDAEQIELGSVAASFCVKNAVVPIRLRNSELCFVVANPFDLEMFDLLKRMVSGKETLKVAIASARTIRFLFGSQGITREFGPALDVLSAPGEGGQNKEGIALPTVAATHSILAAAISQRASDIHVEPKRNHFDVRFRVDGEMKTVYAIEKDLGLKSLRVLRLWPEWISHSAASLKMVLRSLKFMGENSNFVLRQPRLLSEKVLLCVF